jgi:hypothetical protein
MLNRKGMPALGATAMTAAEAVPAGGASADAPAAGGAAGVMPFLLGSK